ncbi:MAG: Ig-like domain-containing protein [Flavobacteriaceae bacterium]|nr:Ig-like domain-containing protein [Flavobacteriaceae bacterium]
MKLIDFRAVFLFLLLALLFTDCAKRGMPSGGPLDTIPPSFVRSLPDNNSRNFDTQEIRIYFDEFVRLKDLNKQVIVSPPLKNRPIISPQGNSARFVKIRFMDSLLPETTYSVNFGNAIVDNNEENPLPYFKYVFSTGKYIDSLQLKGKIRNAASRTPDDFVSLMLYEVDEDYTDSIIFKERPRYIANTLAADTFQFDNLKAGKYRLIAVKDKASDNLYQPQNDKLGYWPQFIDLPTDEQFELSLFQEVLPSNIKKPSMIAEQKLLVGFEGEVEKITLKSIPEELLKEVAYYKSREADTFFVYYKPPIPIAQDSLVLNIKAPTTEADFTIFLKDLKRDSLSIKYNGKSTINFKDPIVLSANVPLKSIDPTKIQAITRDSTAVDFEIGIDTLYNEIQLNWKRQEEERYSFKFFPGAVTDFFEETNDTLDLSFRTGLYSDYGTMSLSLQNVPEDYPLIVQLVDDKDKVLYEITQLNQAVYQFDNVDSGLYFVRFIYDENSNGRLDTGNFIQKTIPERVLYMPEKLEFRANWDLMERYRLPD